MNPKIFLIITCLILSGVIALVTLQAEKRITALTQKVEKLTIQKDSLLAEKMDYEKRFLQLLQQFDTIVSKKALDSTVIFIPKNQKKGKSVSTKKSDVFK